MDDLVKIRAYSWYRKRKPFGEIHWTPDEVAEFAEAYAKKVLKDGLALQRSALELDGLVR